MKSNTKKFFINCLLISFHNFVVAIFAWRIAGVQFDFNSTLFWLFPFYLVASCMFQFSMLYVNLKFKGEK